MKIVIEMTNEEKKAMELVGVNEQKIQEILLEKIDNISVKKAKIFHQVELSVEVKNIKK